MIPVFSRFFGKAQGSADPEGWQVGDWAECLHMGQWHLRPGDTVHPGPRHSQVLRVISVRVTHDPDVPGGKLLTLRFAAWPGSLFQADQFRKLNPRADQATAAEAEFTQLVRRPPTGAPVPARETIREFQ